MPTSKAPAKIDAKTDKAGNRATSDAPKVFDIARPGKSAASATSRPIIVSNRTILQDPMVTADTEQVLPVKQADKVNLRPLEQVEEKKTNPSSAPEVTIDLSSVIDAVSKNNEKSGKKDEDTATPAEAAQSEAPDEEASTTAEEVPAEADKDVETEDPSDEKEEPTAATSDDKITTKAEDTAETTDNPSKDAVRDESLSESDGTPAADGTNADSAEQKELAALEAKAKQEEAIEQLVDSKEYFLPINSVERHKSKVIALLGLMLIVILALALLDIMVDSGAVHIPGVHPLTHFFHS